MPLAQFNPSTGKVAFNPATGKVQMVGGCPVCDALSVITPDVVTVKFEDLGIYIGCCNGLTSSRFYQMPNVSGTNFYLPRIGPCTWRIIDTTWAGGIYRTYSGLDCSDPVISTITLTSVQVTVIVSGSGPRYAWAQLIYNTTGLSFTIFAGYVAIDSDHGLWCMPSADIENSVAEPDGCEYIGGTYYWFGGGYCNLWGGIL